MSEPEASLSERLQLMLSQRWDTPFDVWTNPELTVVVPTWTDGPTITMVKALRDELPTHPGENEELTWSFRRNISPTAWALVRGPQHAPSNELPWNPAQIQAHLADHQNQLDLSEVYITDFQHVDLRDLTMLAGPDRLAQAEVAATLGMEGRRRHRWEQELDIWLRHGGWTMAGRLLTSPSGASPSSP